MGFEIIDMTNWCGHASCQDQLTRNGRGDGIVIRPEHHISVINLLPATVLRLSVICRMPNRNNASPPPMPVAIPPKSNFDGLSNSAINILVDGTREILNYAGQRVASQG